LKSPAGHLDESIERVAGAEEVVVEAVVALELDGELVDDEPVLVAEVDEEEELVVVEEEGEFELEDCD
jgi:hypothetical protein